MSEPAPPSVSVLLPVRNAEDQLEECVASLRGQTLADFEVLAVDDGSTDATPEILRAWAATDARVRVISQAHAGIVAALEAGRALARGRFLARMDADDIASPDRFAAQLEHMAAHPELSGCGCRVRYFPESAVKDGARRYERWINELVTPDDIERDLFVECPLAHPTFFLRADAVSAVGGYRQMGWPEDYDLILRMWESGARFANVPQTLLEWRERSGRLSRVSDAYGEEAFRRIKVSFLQRTLLRGRDGVVVWGAGPTGKAFARTLLAQGERVVAFVDLDRRKVGQVVHGATVVRPEEIHRYERALCVAAVGQDGARAEIRDALAKMGWREGKDFVAVA
jgi:glycosyltransferase involved in cell wall biosynthesis